MKPAGTYKITRQGQITLPAEARQEMALSEGDVMEMYYTKDLVVIKKKKEPLQVFEELAAAAGKRFREKKITRADVAREVKTVRRGR